MSTVNGMIPVGEDVSALTRLPEGQRIQVRDPSPDVPLQPVARPVDTYSRPSAGAGARVIEALGQLNTSLMALGTSMPKTTPEEAKARAAAATASMTANEVSQRYLDGNLPTTGTPAVDKEIRAKGAVAAFNQDATWWKDQLPGWDFANRNLDQEFTDFKNARYQNLAKQDPVSAGQYNDLMETYRHTLLEAANTQSTKLQNAQLLGSLQTKTDAAFTLAETQKLDSSKVGPMLDDVVNKFMADNEKTFGKKAINDAFVARLKDLAADGSPVTAQNILDYIDKDRTAGDGSVLPALSKTGTYADDVRAIRSAAQLKIQKANELTMKDQVAQEDAKAIASGAFRYGSQLQDKTLDVGFGKQVTLTGNDRLKAAQQAVYGKVLPAFQRQVYDDERARGASQDDATARAQSLADGAAEEIARKTGVLDPTKEKRFEGLGVAITTASLSDPAEREEIMKDFHTYSDMVEKNPSLAHSYVKDNHTEDVLKTAWVLNKVARMSDTSAIATAATINDQMAPNAEKELNTKYQQFDTAFQKFLQNPDNSWGNSLKTWTTQNPDNRMQLEAEFRQVAQSLIRAGKPVDTALQITKQYFQDPKVSHFMWINGNIIRSPQNVDPDDFGYATQKMIDNYLSKEGKTLGYKPDDITVRQNQGQQAWTLINKSGGIIENTNGAPATFTLRDVNDILAARQAARNEELKQENIDINNPNYLNEGHYGVGAGGPMYHFLRWLNRKY